jgi:hypothetical protein
MTKKWTKDYVEKFWVGVMDGDGSIQVNHWRKKNLQYRFIIKCRDVGKNHDMMLIFRECLGGNVRKDTKNGWVLWICDRQSQILRLLQVLEKYPPLTTRLNAQIRFLRQCLNKRGSPDQVTWYLQNRDHKYSVYQKHNVLHLQPLAPHFPEWLSGFIEAEGCFCVRNTSNNHSFSIGQKGDSFLLQHIKDWFQIQTQIRNPKNDFWLLETYRQSTFVNLDTHFHKCPLLGAKSQSYETFKNVISS